MRGQRRQFTAAEIAFLWSRRQAGESLSSIGRSLDRSHVALYQVVERAGGVPPRPRRRSARGLQPGEREEISRGVAAGLSVRQIAARLKRAPSTVSRELERNGGRAHYRASDAEERARKAARRPQACVLAQRPRLRRWVSQKLLRDWSPRQIAVGLRQTFPDDCRMRVSHETIYRTLFVQSRGALKRELTGHLRRGHFMRRPRTAQRVAQPSIVDGVSIRERPPEAEDRAVPGHWEGDLLMGGNSSQVATLVERRSRFVMLIKLDTKDTVSVTKAVAHKIRRLPAELRRSLTWDRGSEMAAHKEFTVATDVQVYFCDPRSPWQRGSNENTNGLLRQYFPKGADLSRYSQAHLNGVARRLNTRPRETLNWLTPATALANHVALTG